MLTGSLSYLFVLGGQMALKKAESPLTRNSLLPYGRERRAQVNEGQASAGACRMLMTLVYLLYMREGN